MSIPPRSLSRGVGLLAVCIVSMTSASAAETPGVKLTDTGERVRIEVNGELLTEYCYKGAPHVYFYPVLGPGGVPLSRNWPMKDVEGEEHDHKHHRSLWFSHGRVNGVDFWSEEPKAGKIEHEKFYEIKSGSDEGVIRSKCRWVAPGGEIICTDERTFRVYRRPGGEKMFDFDVTLKAPGDKELILGDTKEGSMAIRVNEKLRVALPKKQVGTGKIITSEGIQDADAWGKRAKWVDYHGPLDGKTFGIAILDHPQNPRHPTTWHVRDYGLFAVNPFGLHDFDKANPPGTGNLVVAPGKTVTFRYRFVLHEGDEKQAKIAERFAEYAAGSGK